jgi:biotin-dependent carboxylase-like uncharacterized protein
MDRLALLSGQHQLRHHQDEAAIEMAYADFVATPAETCRMVVTGAPVSVTVDQSEMHLREPLTVRAGQTIAIKATAKGVYSYLHVSGGVATPQQLGSRSTSPRERIGGLSGRFLQDGDTLPLGPNQTETGLKDPKLHAPASSEILWLRFVAGFQYVEFAESAIKQLLADEFIVTAKANRMGVTLSGGTLQSGLTTLLSEATCYGAIQVPPDGNPIILLNDRQTVGGYPKPGAVIASDCLRLAQARPGQKVRFAACRPDEADRISWLEQHYVETRLRDVV